MLNFEVQNYDTVVSCEVNRSEGFASIYDILYIDVYTRTDTFKHS